MTIDEQMKEIETLRGAALRQKFEEVVGHATSSQNRPYVLKTIRKALEERLSLATTASTPAQAPSEGDADASSEGSTSKRRRTKGERAAAPRREKGKRERDPRLPPAGQVLEREHEGKTVRVKVHEEDFEYQGKKYRSLSAIAKKVTGTSWNGFLFFNLADRAKKSAA
jgi:hypothetical protein